MNLKRSFLLLFALLFLAGSVDAYYANINGSGATRFLNPVGEDEQWIIAGPGQQNTVTLLAFNDTAGYAGPVKNAIVTFYVDDISLGGVSPQTVMTDVSGRAVTMFTVNSTRPKSGTARITAVVESMDPSMNVYETPALSWYQKIDHNAPYSADFSYEMYNDVASTVPVNITVKDRWGNLIDDKKPGPAHNLTLHVNGPSPPNDCGFTSFGLSHDEAFSLDPSGHVAFDITSATKPGWHYILMDPMGVMPEQMKMFDTIASGEPFAITQTFSPEGNPYPTVLADGASDFVFYYTLYDRYGNPTAGQDIHLTITSLDNTTEPMQRLTLTTGGNGQNWTSFGPKSITNRYSIEATPARNNTIWANKTIRFYNSGPTNIDVQANPQSMPSLDANEDSSSTITAKVVDFLGKGVAAQEISFEITNNVTVPIASNLTREPSFSKTEHVTTAYATTDENGYASVQFYPGSLARAGQPGFQEAVTDTTTITAVWNNNPKDVKVTWKNYPYLSAVVSVYPAEVQVGETVNVSLKLKGDGWALYHFPIDVDLVMDRSGSMNDPITSTDPSTKLTVAKNAAKNFVNNMSEATDRVGLFSFSSANAADPENSATHNAFLSGTFLASTSPINTAITNLQSSGNTALRPSVKQAIDDLVANPNGNAKAVRAVIVMTDGDWNDEGSPAGHGTGWPVNNPDGKSYISNNNANNYRYYPDLPDPKGTLSPYSNSTCIQTQCDSYQKICNTCRDPYKNKNNDPVGTCCTGNGNSRVCHYPDDDSPSWCSATVNTCITSHCVAYGTVSKCTDGEFTNQNLSVYAKNNGIRLYFIFFTGSPGTTTATTLSTMANATGGFYQQATTASDLDNAYKKIAGDLKTVAGVDTTATLDFSKLIINDQPATDFVSNPYFEYIGDPAVISPRKGIDLPSIDPGSTKLDKYILNEDGSVKEHFSPGSDDSNNPFADLGPIIINQTTYWNTAPHKQQLHFNISTVGQNETWEADFRLKVLREGNILIFGPDSKINFNNGMAGASSLTLPNLSLTSSMNGEDPGLALSSIDIFGLARRDSGMVKGTLPVAWTMTYTGAAADTITEEVSYIRDDDPPVRFAILSGRASDLAGHLQTATLDTENLPPGGYTIRVHAYAHAASATRECGPYPYMAASRAFILLR